MKKNANKTRLHYFFITYNNINFYDHVRDQQLHNQSTLVNYTGRYIYFIKIPEESRENNTWLERYINFTQINQRLINDVANEVFDLTQIDHSH